MSTNAIFMMAISLIIIWGGLLISVIRLPKENPIGYPVGFLFVSKSAVGFLSV